MRQFIYKMLEAVVHLTSSRMHPEKNLSPPRQAFGPPCSASYTPLVLSQRKIFLLPRPDEVLLTAGTEAWIWDLLHTVISSNPMTRQSLDSINHSNTIHSCIEATAAKNSAKASICYQLAEKPGKQNECQKLSPAEARYLSKWLLWYSQRRCNPTRSKRTQ